VPLLPRPRLRAKPAPDPAPAPAVPSRRRRAVSRALTALAGVLVLAALIVPDNIARLPPGYSWPAALLRIPIEGLAGAALLLVLPARHRLRVATVLGAGLGLLTVVKIFNMGFFTILARPFNPVLDWALLDDAVRFLTDSVGRAGAVGAAVGAAVLAVALLVLMALSIRRLAGTVARHRTATRRTALAGTAAWVSLALLGTGLVPGVFVASDTAATLAYSTVLTVPQGVQDRRAFAREAAVDAYRDTPDDRLLGALRGKDVVFTFIESYGRSAVEDPRYAAEVGAVLRDGGEALAADGWNARSGYLTSSTIGGGSWLAHATFQSGLWIDNEQRYRTLVSGDRMTLNSAFGRTGVRTVGIEPGITFAWPEGRFYRFDQIYDSHTLGYRGPPFGWVTMPDQYTLSAFQRFEHGKRGRGPLAASVTLLSSHTPWAPIPQMINWADVGDGSVYGPMVATAAKPGEVWSEAKRVRAEYRKSIEYSLTSVISYVKRYGDDNLVMVFLGDHQPAPIITGEGASRDVPITVVTRDRAVLDRIASWNWTDGLKPAPDAPVWRMDAFRDRFLAAFSGPVPAGRSQALGG
jgi:hypothetical protein